jgi:hypothetical protein
MHALAWLLPLYPWGNLDPQFFTAIAKLDGKQITQKLWWHAWERIAVPQHRLGVPEWCCAKSISSVIKL